MKTLALLTALILAGCAYEVEHTGSVECSGEVALDTGDLNELIECLYQNEVNGTPVSECLSEDVQSGIIGVPINRLY